MSKNKFEDIEFTGGYTLLMLKAEEGNFDEVQRMISELKNIDVDAANKKGYTALALAVKAGHSDVVRLLIASGANPDLKNNSGQSPLFLACWNNHDQIMEVLLDNGVEINTVDHRGWTPLMIAAYHGHRHIVRELLLRKADASIQDLFGKKAVDRAKDQEIIRMLQGGNLNKVNYSSPRLKEKGNLPYSPGRTAGPEIQRTQESQLSSILKKSGSRISMGAIKTENERSQPHLSPETVQTVQETGPSGKKAAPAKVADKKTVEQRKNSGAQPQRLTPSNKKEVLSTGKSTPAGRSDVSVSNVISPSKSQNSRRVSNSPTSALDRQMFKEDIIYLINEQMDQVGPKMQQIIENKIALEIPMQMQTHENQFKKQMETVLRYKATDIFKNLQAIFNLKLKFCLTRLGYDTNELGMNNFLESETGFDPETITFDKEPLRAYNEKEFKAIESDINRLEKAVLSNKIPQQAGSSPNRNKGGEQCDHTSQLHRTEIRNEVFDHVGHEVRSTTEYLLEYSHGRVNEMAREESGMLYKKIMAEVTDNMDALEDELKRKFEEIINFKMNKIIDVIGSAAGGDVHELKKSIDKGYNKSYASTGNPATGKTGARDIKAEPSVSSVYSERRVNETRQKSGQVESNQAKDKIMKLKNSLNFMDESGEQRPERTRQSGGTGYQNQERVTYDDEEEVERAPEQEVAEEENDEDAEVERIYNPSYRSTLKGESVQQSGQREYWSPGLTRGNSGSKSKGNQQPQGRGTADSKSNQKSKQIPGHRVEQGGEQEMMKYYDFSNE